MEKHCVQTGIVEQHFQRIAGRRVPVKDRTDVLAHLIKHNYLNIEALGLGPLG